MPRMILAAFASLFFLPVATVMAQEPLALDTPEKQYSYAIGTQLGGSVKQGGVPDLDVDALMLGVRDVLEEAELKLTDDQVNAAMLGLQTAMQAAAQAAAEKTLKDGQAFLAENKDAEGVTTTESGLQYKVLTEGSGAKPSATDTVQVHYEGKLLNGTIFDSSYARGTPAEFPVGGVIPGWVEVLQLMPEGSTWEVFIPSELAYGERGAGGDIGPNEMLTFKVELIKIVSAE
ncbi:MAG: FKBP-type peptidyl-prolyl cis-trans isomerase [Pseudomonadota bacterium]